jgi:hypothetical protein
LRQHRIKSTTGAHPDSPQQPVFGPAPKTISSSGSVRKDHPHQFHYLLGSLHFRGIPQPTTTLGQGQ